MVCRRGAFHGETENICSEMRAILGEARGIYGEGRTVGLASFRLLGLGFNHIQGFAHRAGIGVKRRAHRLAQRVRQPLQPVGTLPAKRLALLLDLRLTTAACEVETRGRLKLLACSEARTILSLGQVHIRPTLPDKPRRGGWGTRRVRIIFACSGRHFSCPTFLVSGRAIWRMSQHEGPFPSPSSRCRNRASPSCGPYAPNRGDSNLRAAADLPGRTWCQASADRRLLAPRRGLAGPSPADLRHRQMCGRSGVSPRRGAGIADFQSRPLRDPARRDQSGSRTGPDFQVGEAGPRERFAALAAAVENTSTTNNATTLFILLSCFDSW